MTANLSILLGALLGGLLLAQKHSSFSRPDWLASALLAWLLVLSGWMPSWKTQLLVFACVAGLAPFRDWLIPANLRGWVQLLLLMLACVALILLFFAPEGAEWLTAWLALSLAAYWLLYWAYQPGLQPTDGQGLQDAVRAERERIYRNLHDDLGARLLSLVYRAQSEAEADFARCLLADLRDAVARTVQMSLRLPEVMADLREETSPRLSAVGLELLWPAPDQIADLPLPPAQVALLRRVVRELVSNVIKHAQARRVTFGLRLDERALELAIQDDGLGMPADAAGGSGISNIRSRLQAVGGTAHWQEAEPCGTLVRIQLPMARA